MLVKSGSQAAAPRPRVTRSWTDDWTDGRNCPMCVRRDVKPEPACERSATREMAETSAASAARKRSMRRGRVSSPNRATAKASAKAASETCNIHGGAAVPVCRHKKMAAAVMPSETMAKNLRRREAVMRRHSAGIICARKGRSGAKRRDKRGRVRGTGLQGPAARRWRD
jgi:hypothetical protein